MEPNEVTQYKELTPEEVELMTSMFEGNSQSFVRVGPKGYLFSREYCSKHALEIYNMELRQGDIFVSSYQRSGTTWTQELVWLVANGFDYDKAVVPLTRRYAFLEIASIFDDEMRKYAKDLAAGNKELLNVFDFMTIPATKTLPNMPSPRFVKTHLPMSLLSPKILDTAKVVYVARDPRDVAVSCFHHARLLKFTRFKGCFRDLWNAFRKDLYFLTPYFDHVKEAWELRNHPNMLFLFYEDLTKDLPTAIRRVSEFLGKEAPTPEQIERLCDHLSIEKFKQNMSVNYEEIREFGLLDSRETFVRKGKVGGWRQYFDDEMEQEAERWIADKLRGSDLEFPSMKT